MGKERCSTQRDGGKHDQEGSQEERGSSNASSVAWSGLASGFVPQVRDEWGYRVRGTRPKTTVENFLEYVIQHLVDAPDEVLVTKQEQGKKLIFKVEMRRSDVGKVIGRNGHTITAMRNLLTAAAARTDHQAILQIVE